MQYSSTPTLSAYEAVRNFPVIESVFTQNKVSFDQTFTISQLCELVSKDALISNLPNIINYISNTQKAEVFNVVSQNVMHYMQKTKLNEIYPQQYQFICDLIDRKISDDELRKEAIRLDNLFDWSSYCYIEDQMLSHIEQAKMVLIGLYNPDFKSFNITVVNNLFFSNHHYCKEMVKIKPIEKTTYETELWEAISQN